MKNFSILALLVLFASSCSNDSDTKSGKVTLKASAITSKTKSTLTSRTGAISKVIITDFRVNIGNIEFEFDNEDPRFIQNPKHDDIKLVGPFMLDLFNPNLALTQAIATINVPNAKYEEIEFNFKPSIIPGEMFGKTYLIKGTIDGKPFEVWSTKEAELELDFEDPIKDFIVNSDDQALTIKFKIDSFLSKLTELASQGLLVDTNGDGIIQISTDNDDDNQEFGKIFKDLIENDADLDDRD